MWVLLSLFPFYCVSGAKVGKRFYVRSDKSLTLFRCGLITDGKEDEEMRYR